MWQVYARILPAGLRLESQRQCWNSLILGLAASAASLFANKVCSRHSRTPHPKRYSDLLSPKLSIQDGIYLNKCCFL